MKKLLLTTTSIGLITIASSAFAGVPKVTIGGKLDTQFAFTSQEDPFKKNYVAKDESSDITVDPLNPGSRGWHTSMDSDLYFKIDGKSDVGLEYGAFVDMNADVSEKYAHDDDRNSEQAYVYIGNESIGQLKMGSMYSSSHDMSVDASTIARAAGGINGMYYQYVTLTSYAHKKLLKKDDDDVKAPAEAVFAITSDLPVTAFPQQFSLNDHHDNFIANKITYTSPSLSGLQIGLSFTPDLDEKGTTVNLSSDKEKVGFQSIMDYAVVYKNEYEGFKVNLAVTGQYGTPKEKDKEKYDDISAFTLGGVIEYQGLSLAGSWLQANNFGQLKDSKIEYQVYTIGAAYENGPFGVSVTALQSDITNGEKLLIGAPVEVTDTPDDGDTEKKSDVKQKNEFKSISFGVDYKLTEGFLPYAEVTYFEANDNKKDHVQNKGYVFLVGTKVHF